MEFHGKPMFLWNVEKCLEIFDEVYVSSDSYEIIRLATLHGAKGIKRGAELCGDTPDIPVFQHALARMRNASGVVAVHANNPSIEKNLIRLSKKLIEGGVEEVMTCHPMTHSKNAEEHYKGQHNKINGSIRAFSRGRLEGYEDAYRPNPEVLIVDDSVEIEVPEDVEKASCQFKRQL